MMELTGKVILDDETLKALKKEVREDVLNDIKEDGLSYKEAVRFATEIDNVGECMNFMRATLPILVAKLENSEFHFDDEKKYKKLKMCCDILNM